MVNTKQPLLKREKPCLVVLMRMGALEETETDIKVAELHSSVTNYINTKYNGASIKETAMIINAKGEKLYEATVKSKDLLVDMQGKFLKEEAD